MTVLYTFPGRVGMRSSVGATALHQLQGVAGEGVEVSAYCASADGDVEGLKRVVETLAVGRLRIPHRALGIERAYRYHDWRVASALKRRREEVELVHCWPHATLRTARVARAQGIKVVREVPNTHTAYAFETVAEEMAMLGLEPIPGHSHTFDADKLAQEEAEYEAADVLLVPSEFSKRTFLERGFPSDRLTLHQYGTDPRHHFPGERPPDRPFTALFVGSCEPRKGLHYALRAWIDSGAAERGRFVVIGRFVPGYREALKPLLEHPSVDVRGFAGDTAWWMRESDILVLPSIEDGSALVTYEAQACGCVLVVSEAAGARCEHLGHGLVHAPRDLPALTEHIRLLHEDRALLARLREATLARRETLTWRHAAKELAGVYRAISRSMISG